MLRNLIVLVTGASLGLLAFLFWAPPVNACTFVCDEELVLKKDICELRWKDRAEPEVFRNCVAEARETYEECTVECAEEVQEVIALIEAREG